MNIFTVTQVIIAILLSAAILVQQRGTGLGSTFGADTALYRSKRGVEKILFIATVLLSALFAVNAIVLLAW